MSIAIYEMNFYDMGKIIVLNSNTLLSSWFRDPTLKSQSFIIIIIITSETDRYTALHGNEMIVSLDVCPSRRLPVTGKTFARQDFPCKLFTRVMENNIEFMQKTEHSALCVEDNDTTTTANIKIVVLQSWHIFTRTRTIAVFYFKCKIDRTWDFCDRSPLKGFKINFR